MISTLQIDITKDPYFIMGSKTGEEKGIEKGLEKGIEKGKKIVAVNAIINNLDAKTISIISGLSIDVVNQLITLYNEHGDKLLLTIENEEV